MANNTIDYLGIDAATEIYKRNKRRLDKLVAESQRHTSRLDVIEREAANVQRITDQTVHQITGKVNTGINYIK